MAFLVEFFQFPFRQGNSEQAKVLWIVKLRWLAATLFLLTGAIGFLYGYPSAAHLGAYLGIMAILIVFNVFTQLIFSNRAQAVPQVVICFQLAFDLLVLCACLYLTGGIENPFLSLFLLNASLGALLIPGYLTLPFLLLVHTMVAVLQLDYFSYVAGVGHHPFLLWNALVFHFLIFGFWLVMRSLGRHFEQQHSHQVRNRVLLAKQDRLRAIGSLAAGFSHEFASPLNTAKIRLERLLRHSTTGSPQEDAREAFAAIQACELVIQKMNASQIDAREFLSQRVSIKNLLNDIVETWKTDHPNLDVKVKVGSIQEIDLPPVNFAQVVLNLLDNAVEAHPTGDIVVVLQQNEHHYLFSVEDEGPGFSAAVIEKLGEPFMTTKREGTGLGLYVSQIFAQSLGGELHVKNGPMRGAMVTIEWPCGGFNRG